MLKNANELNFLYVNVCNYSYLFLTLSSELIKINVKTIVLFLEYKSLRATN